MSSLTLARLKAPRVHWSDEARESAGIKREFDDGWFEEFDKVLSDLGIDESLDVRCDADTWYLVNDMDVSFPADPSAPLGLDTWDF